MASMNNQDFVYDESQALNRNTYTGPSVTVSFVYDTNKKAAEPITVIRQFKDWKDNASGLSYVDSEVVTNPGNSTGHDPRSSETVVDVNLSAEWNNATIILPTPKNRYMSEGYTFDSWYGDSGFTQKLGGAGISISVSNNKTVYAKYVLVTHNVTFHWWDGSTIATVSVPHNQTAVPPAVENIEFTSWDKTLNNIVEDTVITAITWNMKKSIYSIAPYNGTAYYTYKVSTTDGVTWTSKTAKYLGQKISTKWNFFSAENSLFFAVSTDGNFYGSRNGIDWSLWNHIDYTISDIILTVDDSSNLEYFYFITPKSDKSQVYVKRLKTSFAGNVENVKTISNPNSTTYTGGMTPIQIVDRVNYVLVLYKLETAWGLFTSEKQKTRHRLVYVAKNPAHSTDFKSIAYTPFTKEQCSCRVAVNTDRRNNPEACIVRYHEKDQLDPLIDDTDSTCLIYSDYSDNPVVNTSVKGEDYKNLWYQDVIYYNDYFIITKIHHDSSDPDVRYGKWSSESKKISYTSASQRVGSNKAVVNGKLIGTAGIYDGTTFKAQSSGTFPAAYPTLVSYHKV